MEDYNLNLASEVVSVIIPTYKRSEMLGRAIDSVLSQSYRNIEVIVVDDNTDGDKYRLATNEFMQKYQTDNRVKYIKHKTNLNGSAARNTGILNSTGEYIAFLDDDDYFLKDRIFEALKFLKLFPEDFGGVCSNYVKKYKNIIYKVSNNKGTYSSSYEFLSGKVDYAAGSTLLIKKKVLDKTGLFDTSFYRHQDWEFLIRYFRFYKLAILSSYNVVICKEGIRNNPKTDQLLDIKIKLFQTYDSDILEMEKNKQIAIYQHQWKEILYNYIKEKKYSKAFQFARQKIKLSSFNLYDLLNLSVSLITSIFPHFMILIYFVLDIKHKNIRKYIEVKS